jgi:multidrug resistance efflux pump
MIPVPSIPKLRADLLIREQQQADGTSLVIIKDPLAGRFFRFGEVECFIARQLDGHTPLHTVRQKVQDKFSCALSEETLEQFIGTLRRCGLLESEAGGGARAADPGRVRGSILYLRFRAFDPDRLLTRLIPSVSGFFTSGFLFSSALLILFASGITFLGWDEIRHDLRGLWRFDALLLAWVTVLLVTAAHEFAHALTCKHFGGEVREMGFMLIYFQPAFYCNVSDAWLFPEKSRRLWVTFAGAYVETFIWALATLTWRVVEPDTWISFAAMVVMATSAIKSFFNLNPLIKLDGYYLLSDWLEIPNLRQKSLGYLGACFGRFFRSGTHETGAASRRERRIFVTYGLLSGAYSLWLLGYVASRFGAFLIERYAGLGFILFGGFMVIVLRSPVARLWTRGSAALRAAWKAARWRVPLKLAAGSAALAGLLFFGQMGVTVPGEFTALPLHNADIEAEVEGFVGEILVDEGDRVDQGEVIARLSNRDLAAELDKVEAEIEEKRAELEIRLSRARSAVEKTQARFEYARKTLERTRTLLAEGLVSPQQFDETAEEVAVRRQEVEEAQAERRKLEPDGAPAHGGTHAADSRREILELARSELARLESQRRHLEEQIRLLTILSPISGVVTTPRLQLQEKIGQFVEKGELIAEVHELRTLMAEVAVSERHIGEVLPGQGVAVRVKAYPDRSFKGKVVSIAAAASRPEDTNLIDSWRRDKTFLVTTELDNGSLLLKPGMTGHAKIQCGRQRILDRMTRGLTRYIRVEFWSWW